MEAIIIRWTYWIIARCKWILGVAEHGLRPKALHERCCYRHSIATSLGTEVDNRFPCCLSPSFCHHSVSIFSRDRPVLAVDCQRSVSAVCASNYWSSTRLYNVPSPDLLQLVTRVRQKSNPWYAD